MTNKDDITLREYAHAAAVAAVAMKQLRGSTDEPRVYVEDTEVFDKLAKLHRASVKQTQRIPSMRLMEFDAGGVRWVHGVAQ